MNGLAAPSRVTGDALALPLGVSSGEGTTRQECRFSPDQKTTAPHGDEKEGNKNGLPS